MNLALLPLLRCLLRLRPSAVSYLPKQPNNPIEFLHELFSLGRLVFHGLSPVNARRHSPGLMPVEMHAEMRSFCSRTHDLAQKAMTPIAAITAKPNTSSHVTSFMVSPRLLRHRRGELATPYPLFRVDPGTQSRRSPPETQP